MPASQSGGPSAHDPMLLRPLGGAYTTFVQRFSVPLAQRAGVAAATPSYDTRPVLDAALAARLALPPSEIVLNRPVER